MSWRRQLSCNHRMVCLCCRFLSNFSNPSELLDGLVRPGMPAVASVPPPFLDPFSDKPHFDGSALSEREAAVVIASQLWQQRNLSKK